MKIELRELYTDIKLNYDNQNPIVNEKSKEILTNPLTYPLNQQKFHKTVNLGK